MMPEDARLERVLSEEVEVWDVSHLLAKGRGKYTNRDPSQIEFCYFHKSGADGADGFKGMLNSSRYVTSPKPPVGYGRGWPGFPYTFWFSRVPDRTVDGALIIYRGQPDDVRSYHTGGPANGNGIAAAFQGAYDGQWDLLSTGVPRVERQPTPEQYIMADAFVRALPDWHGIEPTGKIGDKWQLTGHWEHGKAVCPGDALRSWVQVRRGDLGAVEPPAPRPALIPDSHHLARSPTTKELQRALKSLGFDPGPVDGIWGHRSRGALERFQAAVGFIPDGWYGPNTAESLVSAMIKAGISWTPET